MQTMVVEKTISVQQTYGETLVKIGQSNPRIVVVEADLAKASGSTPFQTAFPDRYFQVGIAEQNLIGVAAGLAAMGKIPFASTMTNFASQRACDQAVIAAAYNRFNVKICGSYAGLTNEKNGATHISVEDVAIFRSMPNMVVLDPGDCIELESALEEIAVYDGPVFLRMARGPLTTLFSPGYKFVIGKSIVIEEGCDAGLITSGITTYEGVKACELLRSRGIRVRHVHIPTIKPIDRDEIIRTARETGAIVTVENHSQFGGLGSAVTEVVCDTCPIPVTRLGINDSFGETATLDWLMEKFQISANHIVSAVENILRRKQGGVR